jgi:hypothetical protein
LRSWLCRTSWSLSFLPLPVPSITIATKHQRALWTFLEHPGIEPTNNAAADEVFSAGVRALRQAVIQRKITGLPSNSRGVQSRQGAICRSRLLTVTTSLRQQGRDVWQFLEQAWIAHHRGGVMPSLLPDP